MRKRPSGTCHICGQDGPLSFEHIPPRHAFNDRPVIVLKFQEAIALGPYEVVKGSIQQKGAGAYTLCEKCNNITGHWYGKRFVDWCYQGMEILERTEGKPSLFYLNYLFPLAILKQIVTMFFSLNHAGFSSANPDLVKFVLNRDEKYLPPKYRFFVYYNLEGRARATGISAASINGKLHVVSEFSFPPFGYMMTLKSASPDERLVEITHFSRFDYNEFTVMELKLPVLPTHLLLPGDYRTKEQINEDYQKNLEWERNQENWS